MTALDDELASIKATQDATLTTIATVKTGIEALLAKLSAVPATGLTKDQQAALDAVRDEGVNIAQSLSAVNTEANPPAPATATAAPDASAPPIPPPNPAT